MGKFLLFILFSNAGMHLSRTLLATLVQILTCAAVLCGDMSQLAWKCMNGSLELFSFVCLVALKSCFSRFFYFQRLLPTVTLASPTRTGSSLTTPSKGSR